MRPASRPSRPRPVTGSLMLQKPYRPEDIIRAVRRVASNQANAAAAAAGIPLSGDVGDAKLIGNSATCRSRLTLERMLEEEAQHLPRRVRPARIGVGAGWAASRPGVAGTVNI